MFMSIINSVINESSIAPATAAVKEFIASLGVAFPIILIALSLIVGLFGRRLSDPIRFLLLFAVGFVASVYWLAPLITTFLPAVPAYAVGLTVGIFAAVMSRFIYNVVYIGCIGFDVYNICLRGMFLVEITSMTKGNFGASLGVAVGVVVIALFLRKYLEMIITAAAGGIGIAYFAKQLFDYTASFGSMNPNTAMLIVGSVIAIPMFIYQYYNRVIY